MTTEIYFNGHIDIKVYTKPVMQSWNLATLFTKRTYMLEILNKRWSSTNWTPSATVTN